MNDIKFGSSDKRAYISDERLVTQAQQGDEQAFMSLYERYLPRVFGRVRYLVPEGEAEDVTQEVFITMMRSLKNFKGEAKFSTWLYTLIRHRVADFYRKRKVDHHGPSVDEIEDSGLPEVFKTPGRPNVDERIMLRQALNQLPENYQDIIMMRFSEGLQFNEIAAARNQSLEATKSLFRRAMAALRDAMGANVP